ncbi:thioredoxin TrxC [Paraglaciecola sp. 2405UD69-4]|uniref:thioredoxin TrxC n=1 Tax=Paraglaciecola sp. 2405UD69-4 TaxID=3391836 RepID=UPI0039C8C146
MHLVCSHCFAINRIPEGKSHTSAKCGKCKKVAAPSTYVDLTGSNFYRYIEKNDLPVIVDFWATWCGPCQAMAPVFETVAKQSESILFAKVNTEQAQQISAEASIRSIPTLIFFHHGKEIERVSGGLSEQQLKAWILQCLKKLS